MKSIGWPELMQRGRAAAQDLPPDLVYAGMSMGAEAHYGVDDRWIEEGTGATFLADL